MADRSIEAFVREKIAKEYPDHGIFGEEEPPLHVDRKYVWVIDPIDGTKSFVTGHPLFGGLIGLLEDGRPCLGQIDMPVLGERYFAADGQPTLMNGAPCRTSGCTQLSETFAYTTDPLLFSGQRQSALDLLQQKARLIRFGGDCYCYALMAAGHCDLVLETGLQPYDYLPVVKIVQEAGGVITDWSGASLNVASNGDVVAAATPELHAAILERLHPLSRELAT
jgi:histidinol phosphatase-like enzyme (inositol monophosphatase family)